MRGAVGRLLRVAWHVFPMVPTLYGYHAGFNAAPVLRVLWPLAALWTTGEVVRLCISPKINRLLCRAAGTLLRPAEHQKPTGSCYYLWGVISTIYLFGDINLDAAVAGLLCLCLADPAAAVVGQVLGRWRGPPLRSGKSVGGFVAAWVVATIAVTLHAHHLRDGRKASCWAAPFVGLCAATAESFSSPLDDNFLIPLASAACASRWL